MADSNTEEEATEILIKWIEKEKGIKREDIADLHCYGIENGKWDFDANPPNMYYVDASTGEVTES